MMNESLTVLYIDDDTDDLLLFSESIESLYPGTIVFKAQNGEEGIEMLNHFEKELKPFPRLIILDMNIPKMDGRQTLKAIRARKTWNDIPVVIFTTSTNAHDIEFCKNYGSDCVTKPMDYKSLNQTIKHLLSYCGI